MTGFGTNTFNESEFNKSSSPSSLIASGFGGATGTADLTQEINLSASGSGTGTGIANLTQESNLSASGNGEGTGGAAIQRAKEFAASGQGAGTGSEADLLIEKLLGASGSGKGTGNATLEQQLKMSAAGVGTGTGAGSIQIEKTLRASGIGVGVGNAILEASIGNWKGFDDGKIIERTDKSIQDRAQKWLLDSSEDPLYRARFKSFEEITLDMSKALGASSGGFTQGTIGWHIRIDDTAVLRSTDALQLKVGSSPNDYAVWTLDRSELGPNGEYEYLTFSHDEYDSIVGTPDWTNVDFFELTMFETSGNTTDTFIYVDYLTVSDRDNVGATGLGDRRSDKEQIRSGD